MHILKKITKVIVLISLFSFSIPIINDIKLVKRVDKIINSNENNMYEGYIYIPKFNYKNVITKNEELLDENYIYMPSYSDEIGGSNIILAGHNNKYVFNKIYYLNINDEIIISDHGIDYVYFVKKTKYIDVEDYNSLYNNNSITLITCTNDNQKRYIVIAEKNKN